VALGGGGRKFVGRKRVGQLPPTKAENVGFFPFHTQQARHSTLLSARGQKTSTFYTGTPSFVQANMNGTVCGIADVDIRWTKAVVFLYMILRVLSRYDPPLTYDLFQCAKDIHISISYKIYLWCVR
jgi:hypothetical protein